MATTPSTKSLIDTLRVGIAKVESGGKKDPYRATSPDGEAYGKYQFRRNYWWDNNKNNIDSIKKFASKRKDTYGEVNTFEDFRDNDALQEAYFAYYTENHVIPTAAKAIANGNPLKLTLDQAAAMIHFKGSGAGSKIISSGKVEGKTATNLSDLGYLDRYNAEVEAKGLTHVTADNYVKAKEESGVPLSPEEKKIVKSRSDRKADYAKRDKAIDKMEADGVDLATRERKRRDLLKEIAVNGDEAVFDEIISEGNKAPEEKKVEDKIGADIAAWNSRDKNKSKTGRDPRLDTTKVAESTGVATKKFTPEKGDIKPVQRPPIAWDGIREEVAADKAAAEAAKTETKTGTGEGMDFGISTTTEAKATTTEGEEVTDSAGQALEREQGILASMNKGNMTYDKSNYKRELPVDAITGLALGLIGNDQAKNANIPLRTEDVGQAIKAYTSELALRAKEGLPPEVEAAINNKLAEAYQGGLASNVNASGGNRALVLGNQGGLETARNKGLVDLQLADYEAKERAFQQYGEAIQYIDKVRLNRDVANTSMRQQRGLQTEAKGEQLANLGFAKMIDGIKYQKENGPGSANHMYKSAIMQNLFGFDPAMKDDGTGKPGTRSAHLKRKMETELKESTNSEKTKLYYSLPPETREKITQEYLKTPTMDNLYALVDKEQPALSESNTPAPALATPTVQPEQSAAPQLGSFFEPGFKGLLGTEPTKVAPKTDIAALAMAPLDMGKMNAGGLAGYAATPLPTNKAPEQLAPQMPSFDSALAESVANQQEYYNNQ